MGTDEERIHQIVACGNDRAGSQKPAVAELALDNVTYLKTINLYFGNN